MTYDFGDRIKELRNSRKMSQNDLAQKLNVSNSMISAYETGAKQPSVEVLARLALLFDVSMDFMYGFVGNSTEKRDYNFEYIDASGLLNSQRLLIVQLINEFKEANTIGGDNKEFVDNYDYYRRKE